MKVYNLADLSSALDVFSRRSGLDVFEFLSEIPTIRPVYIDFLCCLEALLAAGYSLDESWDILPISFKKIPGLRQLSERIYSVCGTSSE